MLERFSDLDIIYTLIIICLGAFATWCFWSDFRDGRRRRKQDDHTDQSPSRAVTLPSPPEPPQQKPSDQPVAAVNKPSISQTRRIHVNLGGRPWGTVYIFRENGLNGQEPPGRVKIGLTRGESAAGNQSRKRQVSRSMTDDEWLDLSQIYAIDNIPFPRTVENVAHQLMAEYNIRWPRGSKRGREWFRAQGPEGQERAIKAVESAAKIVRNMARKKGRWPAKADQWVRVWRLSGKEEVRYQPFLSRE